MAHIPYDFRMQVLLDLRDGKLNKVVYLSGVLSGLRVRDGLMTKFGIIGWDPEIKWYIQKRHDQDLPDILAEYNKNPQNDVTIDKNWFVGEAQRKSCFSDDYYKGFDDGLAYPTELFYAFRRNGIDTSATTVEWVHTYLLEVMEWVEEAMECRSHLHK